MVCDTFEGLKSRFKVLKRLKSFRFRKEQHNMYSEEMIRYDRLIQ